MRYVALVGAFERDNFGDVACAAITAKVLQPLPVLRAGMLSADMRATGSGPVAAARALRPSPAAIVFCGGETLACDAADGLAMNLDERHATAFLSMPPQARARGVRATTLADEFSFAYVLRADQMLPLSADAPLIYHSVGGTNLAEVAQRRELRQELQTSLR